MVDRDKAAEAILVVNKMNRHADGNTDDSRHTITEDLRAFLAPYTPEQLRITFIDAECAIEAQDETDHEIRDYLHTEGNLPALVDAMNSIIASKGTAARHTAVLYRIDHVLNQAIQSTPADDLTAQSLIIVYNQNIAAINDALRTLDLTMANATAKAADEITKIAEHFALAFRPDNTEDALNQAHKDAMQNVNSVLKSMERDTKTEVAQFLEELNQDFSLAKGTTLFQDTFSQIEQLRNQPDRPGSHLTIGLAQALTGVIGPMSIGNTAASGIAAASGSALHQLILTAGRFAGYSFAPWQAVRLASTVAKAIPLIGIAASLIGVGIDAYAQQQEAERHQELQAASREAKARIVTDGDAQIAVFKQAYHKATIAPIQQIMRDLSAQRGQLTQQLAERSQSLHTLHTASQSANALIHRIHAEEQSLQP